MVDQVRLPDSVERGASGGPTFATGIITSSSGRETRIQQWSSARMRWDVGYGIQTREDFQEVLAFYYARRGRFKGFRFKDFSDYAVDDERFATANGSATLFQLIKTYVDSVEDYVRTITLPVDGTIVITIDGTGEDAVNVNYETGEVTFDVAPSSGSVLRWSGEFDVPVRFDTDDFELEIIHINAATVPSLPIIELRE